MSQPLEVTAIRCWAPVLCTPAEVLGSPGLTWARALWLSLRGFWDPPGLGRTLLRQVRRLPPLQRATTVVLTRTLLLLECWSRPQRPGPNPGVQGETP